MEMAIVVSKTPSHNCIVTNLAIADQVAGFDMTKMKLKAFSEF
jgi:hypothetical protein